MPPSTLRSSAGVSLAVLTSRILGVLRDALFLGVFSVGKLTDAYLIAFRIPNLLRDLFAEGALSSAFVPTFAEALAKGGRERAYRLGNLVLSGLLVVTGALTALGIVYAGPVVDLISSGFDGDAGKLADATRFARVMMPILLLVSVSAAWMAMLNAQQRYLAPAYAPALFNVVSILVGLALLAADVDPRRAMLIWSVGTTVAGLVQALVQLPSLWSLGYRPRLRLAGLLADPDLRRVLRLMAPATLGLAAVQVNVFVNTQFAAVLGDGPVTYLNAAFRLFYLPIGLFGVALATVTTARASADAARGDRAAIAARVGEGTRGVWMLALPSAVGLVVLAEPVVAFLFQRGKFLPSDTAATVPVLQAYMLGVLPYSLVKVYAPAFFAVDRPRVAMIASVASVAANIAFNALTYRRLEAAGLALGTTVGAVVNFAVLRIAAARVIGPVGGAAWAVDVGRLVVANGVLAACTLAAWRASAAVLAAATGGIGWLRALLLFGTIALGFSVYVAALRLLRFAGAEELSALPARLARRLAGRR